MTESLPPSEPQPQQSRTSGFLLIVILLGIFFLIVLVAAILLLPDRGRKLLKLSETIPVTLTLEVTTRGAPYLDSEMWASCASTTAPAHLHPDMTHRRNHTVTLLN